VNLLIFLIVFPLIIAGIAILLPAVRLALRKALGVIAAIVLSAVPIYLLVAYLDRGPVYFPVESHTVNVAMLVVEMGIAGFIL
jgi:ech hydrogenase subunit A